MKYIKKIQRKITFPLIKNEYYKKHTIFDFYSDIDELKKSESLNLEYWSEYQCKSKSLKTYFRLKLDFKIRYIIKLFNIPEHYYIELRNYVLYGGKLTHEFIIWNESDIDDIYNYVCIPNNKANDGLKHRAYLTIFKNGMEYKKFTDVNFLELKQQLNKKIFNKDRDKRYFNRQYKKYSAKAKFGVYHKKSKKTIAKMNKNKGVNNE